MKWDPYDELSNPQAVYRWLRDEAPVYCTPTHGYYVLSRYADVANALQDHHAFSSRLSAFPGPEDLPILQMDPPKHDELRAIVVKPFLPREVATLEGRVRQIVTRRLDALANKGRGDIVTELADLIPAEVVSGILGVENEADQRQLTRWAADFLARDAGDPAPTPRAYSAIREIKQYFTAARRERERCPRHDLINTVSDAKVRGARLSDGDHSGICAAITVAGFETTTNLICHVLVELFRHQEQRAWLVQHPEGIPNAIKETVRYCSPAPMVFRLSTRDVQLHGTTIPKGSRIVLLLAAASWDERRYSEPSRFDIHREDMDSLGFGLGRHTCFGAPLARLETKVVLEEVLRRFPCYQLDESTLKLTGPAAASGYERVVMQLS